MITAGLGICLFKAIICFVARSLVDKHKAASKDELLEMIRFGADTVHESLRHLVVNCR